MRGKNRHIFPAGGRKKNNRRAGRREGRGLPASLEQVGHVETGDVMLFGEDCVVLFYRSFDTPYSYTRIAREENAEILTQQLGQGDADVHFDQD